MINVSSTQSLRFCVECTQVPFFSQIMGTNACENATETVIRIIWKCASWRPCQILHCYGLELWAVGWHMDLRWLSFKMNAPLKKGIPSVAQCVIDAACCLQPPLLVFWLHLWTWECADAGRPRRPCWSEQPYNSRKRISRCFFFVFKCHPSFIPASKLKQKANA